MSLRFDIAKFAASSSRFVLKKVLRRDGGFFPGKLALKIFPNMLAELSHQFDEGTVLVTGTNGKTSVTALIADCMRYEGAQVAWNKTGANLASGVASAILDFKPLRRRKKFGVFEVDELWVANVLLQLKSKFLLLLNLFPDQLDRFGSIENIQKSLIEALNSSPDTVLVYNADDPNCQIIADECQNNTIPFGVAEKISKVEEKCINKCPNCHFDMNYKVHQYAQLGLYRCPNCGFNRANVKYCATDIQLSSEELSFSIGKFRYTTRKAAEFVCYNLTGFIALVCELGCHPQSIERAVKFQKADNGRMQFFEIDNKNVMINLAKNPVGFNQNINLILDRYNSSDRPASTAVAFFVNAREGDGRNTNWLNQVDFSRIAGKDNIMIYYGGEAYSDIGRILNNNGIAAHRVGDAKDLISSAQNVKHIYIIANYTAMFPLREELLVMSK